MSYATERFGFGYHLTPWVKRLLVANTAVFLLTAIVGGSFSYDWLGFSPQHAFTRPWGALTYMFVHADVWHLLLNMLGLFFFGPPLEGRWGSREFIKYYLLCGMGGVFLSFLFAPNAAIIGASAAVYGVVLAFAWYWPETPIYVWGIFPVKAKWLVGFFFFATLISAFGGGARGGVANFAHLGGLLTGVGYLKFGDRFAARLGEVRTSGESRRFAIVPRKESREEVRGKRSGGRRDSAVRRQEEDLLDEVDRILDKISARGMGVLTDEERNVLDEMSRRRRSN
ncbi:MAG: rhomboid family intramembrane serine protease [Gemmatimonadetes bacterium]|nr:rhomboid family intramembrane serine protease [Gemmatimonadota bacterium]